MPTQTEVAQFAARLRQQYEELFGPIPLQLGQDVWETGRWRGGQAVSHCRVHAISFSCHSPYYSCGGDYSVYCTFETVQIKDGEIVAGSNGGPRLTGDINKRVFLTPEAAREYLEAAQLSIQRAQEFEKRMLPE